MDSSAFRLHLALVTVQDSDLPDLWVAKDQLNAKDGVNQTHAVPVDRKVVKGATSSRKLKNSGRTSRSKVVLFRLITSRQMTQNVKKFSNPRK